MPLVAGAAVLPDGPVLCLDHGLVDILEYVGHHRIPVAVDACDRLDHLAPAGRIRRHFGALLVIFIDPRYAFAEFALQGRVLGEVMRYGVFHAFELAFDHAFGGFAAGFEQDFAVARLQAQLGGLDRIRSHAQGIVDNPAERQNVLVRRHPREIQQRRQYKEPDQAGYDRIGHDQINIGKRHGDLPWTRIDVILGVTRGRSGARLF